MASLLPGLAALARAANPQNWPTTAVVLAATTLLYYGFTSLFGRPSWPSRAPKLFDSYPIVGATRFFSRRGDFLVDSIRANPSGQSAFYVGQKQVVSLSGPDGRKLFFDSKDLSLSAG